MGGIGRAVVNLKEHRATVRYESNVTGPQAMIYLVFTSLIFNLAAFVAILRFRQTAPDQAVATNVP